MAGNDAPGFLAHREGDNVAVAVADLPASPAVGGYLHGGGDLQVELRETIRLGHKFALQNIAEAGDRVRQRLGECSDTRCLSWHI